jgi:hypothetical protein
MKIIDEWLNSETPVWLQTVGWILQAWPPIGALVYHYRHPEMAFGERLKHIPDILLFKSGSGVTCQWGWTEWAVYGFGYWLLQFTAFFLAMWIVVSLAQFPRLIKQMEWGQLLILGFFICPLIMLPAWIFDFYPKVIGAIYMILYVGLFVWMFFNSEPASVRAKGGNYDPPGGWAAEDSDGDGGGE